MNWDSFGKEAWYNEDDQDINSIKATLQSFSATEMYITKPFSFNARPK
jgi:hypothetical protein